MVEQSLNKLRAHAIGAIAAVLMAVAAQPLFAKEAPPIADNPALEQRLNELTENLRCLVCQNQSIADSHAELAIDLKNQIREMMAQGRSDAQIVDFLVQRYGDYVLFKPPMKPATALLWVGPFMLLLAGAAILLRGIARNRAHVAADPLGKEGTE